MIPTPYGNLFAQHKPTPNSELLRANQAKIFCYGHTHVRNHTIVNGLICINPGAISFARDKYDCSYALLEITSDKVDVEFHTLEELISKR